MNQGTLFVTDYIILQILLLYEVQTFQIQSVQLSWTTYSSAILNNYVNVNMMKVKICPIYLLSCRVTQRSYEPSHQDQPHAP